MSNLKVFNDWYKKILVPGTVIYIKTRKPLDTDFRVYAFILELPTAFAFGRKRNLS
ncbi:MAG: hypothetical protein NW226_16130 [Microscillaceae bacterium]|nr:hypothetical protein [Microscillaceae bacterium]